MNKPYITPQIETADASLRTTLLSDSNPSSVQMRYGVMTKDIEGNEVEDVRSDPGQIL